MLLMRKGSVFERSEHVFSSGARKTDVRRNVCCVSLNIRTKTVCVCACVCVCLCVTVRKDRMCVLSERGGVCV